MKDVILHAFNWKYTDIISKLDEIKESEFGAILIPPILYSRIEGEDWWQRYQPIDYRILLSYLGTKSDLETLISKAHELGIKIYADIVLNHMENRANDKYQAPGAKDLVAYSDDKIFEENKIYGDLSNGLFSEWDFNERVDITDYASRFDVQYHQLSGLPDLKENSWVLKQQRELFYELNKMGFDGYRFDAIKHMTERQIDNIADQHFLQDSFLFGEVLTTNEKDINIFMKPYLSETHISAYDFPLQEQLRKAFAYGGSLKRLVNPESTGNALHWSRSVTFVVNHDLPLNEGFRSLMLSPQDEHLANAYILCKDGGVPLVYSDNNESAIQYNCDKDRWAGSYKRDDIRAMVKFHNAVAGEQMHVIYEHDNYLVFRRGDKGIVAINKSNELINAEIWLYGLKNPAKYLDLLHGDTMELTGQEKFNLLVPPRSAQIWLTE